MDRIALCVRVALFDGINLELSCLGSTAELGRATRNRKEEKAKSVGKNHLFVESNLLIKFMQVNL